MARFTFSIQVSISTWQPIPNTIRSHCSAMFWYRSLPLGGMSCLSDAIIVRLDAVATPLSMKTLSTHGTAYGTK